MKIVILTDDVPPRSFGGAGIIASWQARDLAKRGHEVFIITTVQEKSLEKRIIQDGIVIFQIYSNYSNKWRDYISFYNPRTLPGVKDILSSLNPDVVHIHNVHSLLSYHVFKIAKRYSKAVFMTAHDTMTIHLGKLRPSIIHGSKNKFNYKVSIFNLFKYYGVRVNPLRNILVRYYLNKADKIFAVSEALAESLIQNGIKRVSVMNNGIDVESFKASNEDITSFKLKQDLLGKKVIFFGGRISRMKGGDVAFNLIKEISKTIKEACLLIIGDGGKYLEDLKKKAEFEGVLGYIRFIPWLEREKIPSAYFASDVVIVPSLYLDPFPTVNLEAMAAKKPVIATMYGGSTEAIKNNVNGFVIDPDDQNSVIEKTKILLEDIEMCRAFGQAGYELAVVDFSLKKQIDRLEHEYASIVSSHG